MNKTKNILMICYYYPPLADTGCKRSIAFSKYLKKYGFTPYVISVKNPDRYYCILGDEQPPLGIYVEYTRSLFNLYRISGKINAGLYRILKLIGIELKRNLIQDIFCIPDIFIGWIPSTVIKGLKLIRKFKINIVYTSSPPFSSAIIGAILKIKNRNKLYFVMDFRDAMELYYANNSLPPNFRRLIDKKIVKCLLKYVDIFIVPTQELKEAYIKLYPQIKHKIYAIYNGFDFSFLKKINGKEEKFQKFTIISAGNLYLEYGNPEIFFKALLRLKKDKKINNNSFQFIYYGYDRSDVLRLAKRFQIEELVFAEGHIPYEKVLNIIKKSHLQFIRVLKYSLPTKLFDAIAMNIPVLAVVFGEEAKRIIAKYSPSSCILPDESEDNIYNSIIHLMDKYKYGLIQDNFIEAFIENFSRENQTLRLSQLLNQLS